MQSGLLPETIEVESEAAAVELTDMLMAELVYVGGLAQAALDVKTQVTAAELVSVSVVNKGLFVPA